MSLRLIGGTNSREGLVQVQHKGQWGTICDDEWDDKAAKIVCQFLGQPNKYVNFVVFFFLSSILFFLVSFCSISLKEINSSSSKTSVF